MGAIDYFYWIGLLMAVAAFIYLVVGVPTLGYYAIRLAYRRRLDIPLSWHDLWGLNRVNLIFFPEFLDDEGKAYRQRAIRSAKRVAIGAVLGMAAFYSMGEL